MNFSILISLYINEKPEYLEQALQSLAASTITIDEIVLVLDGPISQPQKFVLDQFADSLPLNFVHLEENIGLGKALNAGLYACANEWVARFDTDDLIRPDRFEKQVNYINRNPNIDIVSSWVSEFSDSSEKPTGIRKLPISHEEIIRFARSRCPFNHMAVMYRRSKVLEAGSYQGERFGQDYALWARMIQSGAKVANIPECLVNARAGRDMIQRRGGLKYFLIEYQTQRYFFESGFISRKRFLLNNMQRLPARLSPGWLRSFLYKKLLRSK